MPGTATRAGLAAAAVRTTLAGPATAATSATGAMPEDMGNEDLVEGSGLGAVQPSMGRGGGAIDADGFDVASST
jgi:hypothetical protein